MTCAPDAFNSGDGLVVLEPGASFTGRCGLTRPVGHDQHCPTTRSEAHAHRKSSRSLRAALCALVVVLAAALLAAPAPAKQRHHGGAGTRRRQPPRHHERAVRQPAERRPAVTRYTLHNASGMTVSILDYGGIIQSLSVPDRAGKRGERHARLRRHRGLHERRLRQEQPVLRRDHRPLRQPHRAGRTFTLDGADLHARRSTTTPNSLHGGFTGFDKVMWNAEPSRDRQRRRR